MNPYTFVFIGRSGCGKGTQAELLIEYLNKNFSQNKVFYLQTGQKFRDFISGTNYTNKLAKEANDRGDLQPSFLAAWVWADILVNDFTGDEHLIIDGTPRKLGEAILFHDAMQFYKRKTKVIHIDVSREWSMDRLLGRKREDDTEELVSKRLDWFDQDVVPAINYLKENSDLDFFNINGERTIEEIHNDIVEKAFNPST